MKIIIDYKDGRKRHYYKIDAIMRTKLRLRLLRKGEVHYEIDFDEIKDFNIFDEKIK